MGNQDGKQKTIVVIKVMIFQAFVCAQISSSLGPTRTFNTERSCGLYSNLFMYRVFYDIHQIDIRSVCNIKW